MQLLFQVLCFSCLAVSMLTIPILNKDGVSNKSCGFPNNTDQAFYAYNCNTNYAIQVLHQSVYDSDTDKPMYPVDVKKKILILLDAQNNGVAYQDNKVDVELYEYSYSWLKGGCEWSKIPTFGLLTDIDGCDVAHNCPLNVGPLQLKLPLDLTNYASIIKFLAGDKPYQLIINMYDGKHQEKISCVVAQLKFSIE